MHAVTGLTFAYLFLLVARTLGSWQDGDDGVNRPFGDLPGMPIKLDTSAAPSDCAQLCSSYKLAECKGWVFLKGECSGDKEPLCYLKAKIQEQKYDSCAVSGLPSPPSMLWGVYRPLPVGSIVPQGWLRDQLETQAQGLSGHLPLFWADVMNSSWVGGHADGGLHERTPYWLNGCVPLAYQLGDPNLIGLVNKYVDYILSHQAEDGWLGPDDAKDGNMYWSKFPMLLALRQYHDANSTDDRVLPAIMKFLKCVHKRLFTTALGETWSGARWQDLVLTVHWMLRNHPSEEEQMLWDLAELVREQGFDWKGWFGGDKFPKKPVNAATLYTHGVNNGQAIKSEAVWYRQSQDASDYQSSYIRMKNLDQYHGQASGIFACDEHLAGTMPSRGSELCTVVETMFSYEVLFYILGDQKFAERVELLAYNALPATFTPDMWAHQYLQQSNEMNAIHSDKHVWTHDGPDSTLYGLEPNYGCCTANFNQGWPKFTEHLVMEAAGGRGLVIPMYAPVSVKHKLSNGSEVVMDIKTDYPFSDTIIIDVDCGKDMLMLLMIPSWADNPTVGVNGGKPSNALPGTLYNLTCSGQTDILVKLPMKIRVTRRYNNSVAIYRGPLLFGLHIQEDFKTLRSYAFSSKDYQVTPGSPWNYAIKLSEDAIDKDLVAVETGIKKGVSPFSTDGAPVVIKAKGRLVDSWKIIDNSASPPPLSPVQSSNPLTDIVLLPFGSTNLRIAELPVLEEE